MSVFQKEIFGPIAPIRYEALKVVSRVQDFPAPVGGVITLEDNMAYPTDRDWETHSL